MTTPITADTIRETIRQFHAPERHDEKSVAALREARLKLAAERDADTPDVTAEDAYNTADADTWTRYAEAAADLEQRNTRRVAIIQALNVREQWYVSLDRRRNFRAQAGRDTLEYLPSVLPAILKDAAAFDLDTVPETAEAALHTDENAAQAWREAERITAAYAALREAQARAVRHIYGSHDADTLCDLHAAGQIADALHISERWITRRRHAMPSDRTEQERRELQRIHAAGMQDFLTKTADPVFPTVQDNGYPASAETVRDRLAWLQTMLNKGVNFHVPTADALYAIADAYRATLHIVSWQGGQFLGQTNIAGDQQTEHGTQQVRLANLDWQPPKPPANRKEQARVHDAAKANRKAARAPHPGYER